MQYPSGFWGAVPFVVTNIVSASGTAAVVTVPEGAGTSQVSVNLLAYTGAGTMAVNFFAIGS